MRPDLRTIAAGLAIVVFVLALFTLQYYVSRTQRTAQTASAVPFSTSTTSESTASSTPSQATSTASTTKPTGTPKVKPLPTPTVSTTTIEAREVTSSGLKLMGALVNIVCLSGDRSLPSISGTGVIIDSRGIILTAAHVAQEFLLQDYLGPDKVQCLVRTGSPARRAYLAEPIYVSSSWVKANPTTLSTKMATGNGEYDVSLLAITDTATSTPLPASYPYMPLSAQVPQSGEPVAIASYGAQYLTRSELNYSLYPILVFGTIQNRYTYTEDIVDLFSIKGSAASQEGSSGGGVSNAAGELIGTITTSSIEGDIKNRILNAVTTNHLRSTYKLDTGADLDATLRNNSVASLISNYRDQSKQLGEFLWTQIR